MNRRLPNDFASFLLAFGVLFAQSLQLANAQTPVRNLPENSLREIESIELRGLQTISATNIRKKLRVLPEIEDARHPSFRDFDFAHRVREAVARGFLSSGFLQSDVALISDSPHVALRIQEGPRYRRGPIVVTGVDPAVRKWIIRKLTTPQPSSDQEDDDDEEIIWDRKDYAVGSLFAKLRTTAGVTRWLDQNGFPDNAANIQLIEDPVQHLQSLHIELQDVSGFVLPEEKSAEVPPTTNIDDSIAEDRHELTEIYDRHFSQLATAVQVRSSQRELDLTFRFTDTTTMIAVHGDDFQRTVIVRPNECFFSMADPPAAIRVRYLSGKFIVHEYASTEREDGRTQSIQIGGSVVAKESGDVEAESTESRGFHFSRAAWKEWFPFDETERFEHEKGILFRCGDRELRIDHEGDFVSLSGTNVDGFRLEIVPSEVSKIESRADRLIARSNTFTFPPEVEGSKSLQQLFNSSAPTDDADQKFRISPLAGEADAIGMVILSVIDSGKIVETESDLASIIRLYGMLYSSCHESLSARLKESEATIPPSPVTRALMAYLHERNGNPTEAIRLYNQAIELSYDQEASRRDIEMIIDPSNLYGRYFAQIDIKHGLENGVQLAAPFIEDQRLHFAYSFIQTLPDTSNASNRLAAARQLLTFAYEQEMRASLQEHLRLRVKALEVKEKRLAARAKKQLSDEDEKKRP